MDRTEEVETLKKVVFNLQFQMALKKNSSDELLELSEKGQVIKSGKDLMIGFDPKFLIDALKVIDDEEVEIKLLNPKAPCFIKDDEENYTYLILPVTFSSVG